MQLTRKLSKHGKGFATLIRNIPEIDKKIMELRQKIAQKPAESFYKTLAELLYHGEIIFFLGSESLLSNPSLFLSDKVAERLAEGSDYGTFGNIRNSLPMISQYVEMTKTRNSLLRTINEIIGQECVGLQPHPFADLLSRLKSPALIISSSYENDLETALQDKDMKFAVISHHLSSEGATDRHEATGKYNDSGIMHSGFDQRDETFRKWLFCYL